MKVIILAAAGVLAAMPALAQPVTTDEFVRKAAISDMFEVESSRLALEKQPDKDTKPFARHMVKDHTKTSKELKSLIEKKKINAQLPTAMDDEHKNQLDRLRALNGKEFDTAYDQAQLKGHQEAVALFTRYSESGDNPDLKTWAAKTLPNLKKHLDMAGKLK
jgi:putative membrane protein